MTVVNNNNSKSRAYEPNPLRQLRMNPRSKALAIKAKCAECVGCSYSHLETGFKESISACSSYSCPLHLFRPYRPKKGSR